MLPTWKTLLLRNLLLIAAIESIGLPKAGCALFDFGDNSNAKMKKIFSILDSDGDGFVSRKDFVGIGEKVADKGIFSPLQKDAVRNSFSAIFSFYISAAGGKDVPLTVSLLTDSMKMQKDSPAFKKGVGAALLSLTTPMKLQKPGYLNNSEFNKMCENFGLVNVIATTAAFGMIDANHDGKVSDAELTDTAVYFMTTDDTFTNSMVALMG